MYSSLERKNWVKKQKKILFKELTKHMPDVCLQCKAMLDIINNGWLGGKFWRNPLITITFPKECLKCKKV